MAGGRKPKMQASKTAAKMNIAELRKKVTELETHKEALQNSMIELQQRANDKKEEYNKMNMRFNLVDKLADRYNGDAAAFIKELDTINDWCRQPYDAHILNEQSKDEEE